MIDQEFSSPIIKPRIKLVDDGFITDNTEDTDDSRDWTDQDEDGNPNGRFPSHEFRLCGHIQH